MKIYKKCDVCSQDFEKGNERHYTCPTCSNKDYGHLVGKIAHTPFEPSGLVKVLEIEPGRYDGKQSAMIEHVEDHPKGYKKGSIGRYFAHELTLVDEHESDCAVHNEPAYPKGECDCKESPHERG